MFFNKIKRKYNKKLINMPNPEKITLSNLRTFNKIKGHFKDFKDTLMGAQNPGNAPACMHTSIRTYILFDNLSG